MRLNDAVNDPAVLLPDVEPIPNDIVELSVSVNAISTCWDIENSLISIFNISLKKLIRK